MKLEFTLKKVKKSTLQVQNELDVFSSQSETLVRNEIYIRNFDASIAPTSPTPELIIPLIQSNKWREAHENALLESPKKQSKVMESGISSDTNTLQIDLNKDETHTNAPILLQNAIPGLDKCQTVAEKYQCDIAMRPEELKVTSKAYDAVPVEEFGFALLRGMGWKGSKDEDDKDVFDVLPRHRLLGLGATACTKIMSNDSRARNKVSKAMPKKHKERGPKNGPDRQRKDSISVRKERNGDTKKRRKYHSREDRNRSRERSQRSGTRERRRKDMKTNR